MPITIRICEEEEARLMLEDGSFFEYVNSWSGKYPQESLMANCKRKHFRFEDISMYYKETGKGEDEAVLFEIGDRTILKKKYGGFKLFVKVGPCWVRTARDITGLEGMCKASVLFPDVPVRTLCSEEEIKKSRDLDALARKLAGRLSRCRYPAYYQFGDHEIWYWDAQLPNEMEVYGDYPLEDIVRNLFSDGLSGHIKNYKAARVLSFGEF